MPDTYQRLSLWHDLANAAGERASSWFGRSCTYGERGDTAPTQPAMVSRISATSASVVRGLTTANRVTVSP